MLYRENNSQFYHVSAGDTFDEIVELDLENDIYTIRKRIEGKYKIPKLKGGLKQVVLELLRSLIHPEDGERYMAFWDISTLVERILQSPSKMIIEEFRQKKNDGTWGWVRQNVMLAKPEEGSKKLILCYIMDIDEEKKKNEFYLYDAEEANRIDTVTGLLCTKAFFQEVDRFVTEHSPEGYAMIAVDIDHFKLFNEWYGWNRGDIYLMDIATRLNGVATVLKGYAGYMGGDNFAIFIKHRPEYIEHMVKEIDDYISNMGNMAGFLPNLGLYFVKDGERVSASFMYDRAVLALEKIKGNFTKRYNVYEESMLRIMDQEMSILSEVQKGIEEKEFVIYMQPQVHVLTEKVVGAETLVRWKNKAKGMISPGDFIPVLEKNGFITNLDKYIWEEVCAWQGERKKQGKKLLPVSVNVSRIDALSINLVDTFSFLTNKYEIPRSCIKIEITESIYAEEDSKIGDIAKELREAGFSVYLDDFGSGYSSLNMLKNVYVDALKIDMQFLDVNESNVKKGESIMESVINMARILRIPIIVEGVETKHEVKNLVAMGCRYVQGFYYYRPMSLAEFEELLEKKEVDYEGLQVKQVEQVHTREFFDGNVFTDTMLNNILGGVAFYDMYRDQVELTRVNEQFYKVMKIEDVEFEEYKTHIQNEEYAEYHKMFYRILEEAYKNQVSGAMYNFVGKTSFGKSVNLHIRAFFLRESEGHRIFYVGFIDTGINCINEIR